MAAHRPGFPKAAAPVSPLNRPHHFFDFDFTRNPDFGSRTKTVFCTGWPYCSLSVGVWCRKHGCQCAQLATHLKAVCEEFHSKNPLFSRRAPRPPSMPRFHPIATVASVRYSRAPDSVPPHATTTTSAANGHTGEPRWPRRSRMEKRAWAGNSESGVCSSQLAAKECRIVQSLSGELRETSST